MEKDYSTSKQMSEMNAGSIGAEMSGAQSPQSAGGSKSIGAMQGEMPGMGSAFAEASNAAGMRPGNNIQNSASNVTNISLSGNNNNNITQISNQTIINQEIGISIMNEYNSSGIGSTKLDKMFEELLRSGTDTETLEKVLEFIQQKQLEELIKLLILILQGSESGGIVNVEG